MGVCWFIEAKRSVNERLQRRQEQHFICFSKCDDCSIGFTTRATQCGGGLVCAGAREHQRQISKQVKQIESEGIDLANGLNVSTISKRSATLTCTLFTWKQYGIHQSYKSKNNNENDWLSQSSSASLKDVNSPNIHQMLENSQKVPGSSNVTGGACVL